MPLKRGNVLLLVLGLLLVLSFLLMAMLRIPGTLRRSVAIVAKETQEMYWAESAVLAKLEGYPEGYFADLPSVEPRILGPWMEWRMGRNNKFADGGNNEFRFLLGREYGRFSTSEWVRCAVSLEQNLHELILQADGLKNLSGNIRLLELDSSSRFKSVALNVSAGDLTLDLDGFGRLNTFVHKSPSVRSFMANVEGDVKIRGPVHFDTLRIYSTGTVSLRGNVSVGFAEILGLAGVLVSGDISFSGVLLSKQNIEISGNARAHFPSVALVVGYRTNRLALRDKVTFDGLAVAPSGVVERDSSALLLDSAKALLPFCMETKTVVFERKRL